MSHVRRFSLLLLAFLGIALAVLAGRESGRRHAGSPIRGTALPPPPPPDLAEDPAAPFQDSAFLEAQFEWACVSVERVCGTAFSNRPRLKVVTAEEIVAALVREFGSEVLSAYMRDASLSEDQARHTIEATVNAFCATKESVVYLNRHSLRNGWTAGDHTGVGRSWGSVARMLLVHEVTHALDYQRFPALFADVLRNDLAEVTLREGHAQHVTALVARACSRFDDFIQMLGFSLQIPADADALKEERASAADGHPYARGRHLFDAAAEIGGDRLVDDLLVKPWVPADVLGAPRPWLDARWARLQGK